MEENIHIEKQPLIKGCFHPAEAKEIINSLFYNKIQYHSLSSWSIKERTGADTSFHTNRIAELQKSIKKILAVIEYAKNNGKYLNIFSEVKIDLQEKPD